MSHEETARSALSFIPSDDRDLWVRVGMAIHAYLGPAGEQVWMEWSSTSDRFRESDARSVWRSFRPGPIGHGTLFHEAKLHGWQGRELPLPPRNATRPDSSAQRARDDAAKKAAREAREMIGRAELIRHRYFIAKGFPDRRGPVLDGNLLVPMWDMKAKEIVAVQTISAEGRKRFMPAGCRVSGAVHRIGRLRNRGSQILWLVEGYATGLAVWDVVHTYFMRDDEVRVCFSASQLKREGKRVRGKHVRVITDHDLASCRRCHHAWSNPNPEMCPKCGTQDVLRPVGPSSAIATGNRWWMPSSPGMDANDLFRKDRMILVEALRPLISGSQ